jgi:hypothetical protein
MGNPDLYIVADRAVTQTKHWGQSKFLKVRSPFSPKQLSAWADETSVKSQSELFLQPGMKI